jgi:hypothetical protein
MDEIFLNEFRPPDSEMIDYMLNLSASLSLVSNREEVTRNDSEVLKRCAHSMRVLLAMAVGGHVLFTGEAKHADALADLATALYDTLVLSGIADVESFDISALEEFRRYRVEGPDVSEIPFFNDEDL